MSDKLPSTETVLTQSIAKAEMAQDIFKHILSDREMTRIEILDYILEESEALVLLSEQLLKAMEEDMKAKFAAQNILISAAKKEGQLTATEQVTDPEFPEGEA